MSIAYGILTHVATKQPAQTDRLVLAVGKESVLVAQVIERVLGQARKVDPNTVRIEISAGDETAAQELLQAMSPSLFGELTVVVLTDVDQATDAIASVLSQSLNNIPENVRLVITHPGGVKGKKLLETIRSAGALEANCAELKHKDLESAILAEFKKFGRKATADAVHNLQKSVGVGLGELLAAVSQLCADVEASVIDGEAVAEYYAGITDIKSWNVSDAMWDAKPVEVLEQLRWALEADPHAAIPIVNGLASGLRTLVKYASAPAGLRENDLAAHVGVPPWKLKTLRTQKMKWHPDQLAMATRLLALIDRAGKGTQYVPGVPAGQSLDPIQSQYLIEKNLMAIRPPAGA